jgi:hypothetical protein
MDQPPGALKNVIAFSLLTRAVKHPEDEARMRQLERRPPGMRRTAFVRTAVASGD